ncbi:MAG TPA: hypothetical protein VNX68_01525 [Nitrosopumilaceae archaeon]|jgi:hypothetical protein|nr:hypothetical protein [Nitrosopumilaceae archaeon]
MEKVKAKAKRKIKKKSHIAGVETVNNKSVSIRDVFMFIFKLITFPFYVIYLFLFKIPTDGPAYAVGLLRFVFFVTLSVYTSNFQFKHILEGIVESQTWIPISANTILGIYAIIMLLNLFLSFMEMCGLSTGAYWYSPHDSFSDNSASGYDAMEEGIDYRDALLRTTCGSGNSKIKELKKTGFITKERLSSLGSSPEVNEAFELLNSQMRASGTIGKLNTLEDMFGGKK